MIFVLALLGVLAACATTNYAIHRLEIASGNKALAALLVPAADDPRWKFRTGGTWVECGPYQICLAEPYGFLYVGDDRVESISAATGKRLFRAIEKAQGREALTEDVKERLAKEKMLADVIAWHRENTPKALGPETTEHLKGAFR